MKTQLVVMIGLSLSLSLSLMLALAGQALAADAVQPHVEIDINQDAVTIDNRADAVQSNVDNDIDIDSDAVSIDNRVDVFQARANDAGAAAADHSEAYVDNSVDLDDSALARTVMDGEVANNAVFFDDNHVEFENRIEDNSFSEARGIMQVAQNNGVNAVAQQSITVQANMADLDVFDLSSSIDGTR